MTTSAFKGIEKVPPRDDLKTFREWNLEGFYVVKGSKALGFNSDGAALFSIEQVSEIPDFDNMPYAEDYLWSDE